MTALRKITAFRSAPSARARSAASFVGCWAIGCLLGHRLWLDVSLVLDREARTVLHVQECSTFSTLTAPSGAGAIGRASAALSRSPSGGSASAATRSSQIVWRADDEERASSGLLGEPARSGRR